MSLIFGAIIFMTVTLSYILWQILEQLISLNGTNSQSNDRLNECQNKLMFIDIKLHWLLKILKPNYDAEHGYGPAYLKENLDNDYPPQIIEIIAAIKENNDLISAINKKDGN